MSLEALYAELPQIALRSHWSERDILGLPTSKRRPYLRLIASHAGVMEESERA